MWKIQLFKLNYDDREVHAVADVVKSGWITMGEKTIGFEKRFGEFLGGEIKCTAVSSGTAALHMALLALGVGTNDEVIIPSLTFVADINVVKMVGAVPVLADSTSFEDWNINPDDIERKITDKTKAVIVVHYAGYPCNMDAIKEICKRHSLFLIEDAAHAVGAEYKGQQCGSFGNIACFSFFTNKNLSVGEGGMYVSISEELDKKGKYLRSHGMTALTLDRHQGRAISYDVIQPGLNYRIDELRAALGIVQLEKLTCANRQRGVLVKTYVEHLSAIDELIIPFVNYPNCTPAYHIFPVLLSKGVDRLSVINSLKDEGIQSSIHYPAFNEFSAYKEEGLCDTPIANEISRRELTLPLYPTMTIDEVKMVADALKKVLEVR
ncbi:DegT/DnrJ/EryC1/StrS family aminotransferase [bacterium]|nr:DegT/DnrJ/EryC1/StrS family aminotransferase [bacterium]